MTLKIIREDITKLSCDAIVNASNPRLLPSAKGVNAAIHKAAGEELSVECKTLNGCEVGQAKITKGYNLNCRYVIHTVGPIYKDGMHQERELLESCYKNCLQLALDYNIESIAFPLIASGTYQFPKDEALNIATDTIRDFLLQHDMLIYLIVFDKESFEISRHLHNDIQSYIDDHYVRQYHFNRKNDISDSYNNRNSNSVMEYPNSELPNKLLGFSISYDSLELEQEDDYVKETSFPFESSNTFLDEYDIKAHLEELFNYKDESFSKMLFRKIDESGLKDSEIYNRANMDRKLFSKIRCNEDYKPSKKSVIALAIALKMDLDETKEFLCKAGYALSPVYKFDIIIEYFIVNHEYDIFTINNVLFEFDQPLL